jgi:hypothetical protein
MGTTMTNLVKRVRDHEHTAQLKRMRAACASLSETVSVSAPSVAAADHFARAVEALRPSARPGAL